MKCSHYGCQAEACWSYVWIVRILVCDQHLKEVKRIARLEGRELGNVMLIDSEGNRSIFDDVDQ